MVENMENLRLLVDAYSNANYGHIQGQEEARDWARYYKAKYEEMEKKYWEAQWDINELESRKWFTIPYPYTEEDQWVKGYENWLDNSTRYVDPPKWEIGDDEWSYR
jgi:hypothetical protein